MYHYEYVPKKEWKPVYDELREIIAKLQDDVREKFTFQFRFVGSCSRKMITRDPTTHTGFDFDVNIEVNDPEEDYSPEEIRRILREGLDRVTHPNSIFQFRYSAIFPCEHPYGTPGYDYTEDSTRVLTIKVKDRQHSRILHSCDFCIVYNCSDGRQQYIRNNKDQKTYTWEYQPKGYQNLPEKIKWLKQHGLWSHVRDLYLRKKNTNSDPGKHSRAIFAETVNEVWNRHQPREKR